MKKSAAMLISALFLCACLAGCGQPAPQTDADGNPWSEDWITVGNVIGVDTPDGLDPRELNDTLAANGMYYAAWSIGEGESYTDADGEEAELYEGQVYLLLAGCGSIEKAEAAVEEWQEMASELYEVEGGFTDDICNGQAYRIVTYACTSETNPYARGASAFGVYGNYAVNVEIQCQETSDLDPRAVIASFLANCHYAA